MWRVTETRNKESRQAPASALFKGVPKKDPNQKRTLAESRVVLMYSALTVVHCTWVQHQYVKTFGVQRRSVEAIWTRQQIIRRHAKAPTTAERFGRVESAAPKRLSLQRYSQFRLG